MSSNVNISVITVTELVEKRRYLVRGEEVRRVRELMHLSLEDAASRMGWSRAYLHRIESSETFELGADGVSKLKSVLCSDRGGQKISG